MNNGWQAAACAGVLHPHAVMHHRVTDHPRHTTHLDGTGGEHTVAEIRRQLPLYERISPQAAQAVAARLDVQNYGRGREVFHIGDPADHLFIITAGKVKLTRPSRQLPTRESLLWLLGPGDMFGELSLFDEGMRTTSAMTVTPATVARIEREVLLELMDEHSDLTRAVLRQLAGRLRQAHDTLTGLTQSDVSGRLASVLLLMGERFGQATDAGIEVPRDVTQQELGQMIGASRERVNRTLNEFVGRNWLQITPTRFILRDVEKLQGRMA